MKIDRHLARILLPSLLLLAGCQASPPQVLGTLEFDRITLPAPAAEHIVRIDVREGQYVPAGAVIMQLETTRTQAALDSARADLKQQQQALLELVNGPREEQIRQARANLVGAQAQARDANAYYQRLSALARQRFIADADLDRAKAAAGNADAAVAADRAMLDQLLNGSRAEDIAQARAGVAAATATAASRAVDLEKLDLTAPRDVRVDSLPYKLGDQAQPGTPLVILLASDTPFARVYVPAPLRPSVKVGDEAVVTLHDGKRSFHGKVRMIRSEPTFTPYYALSGDDATRLSYLAEIALGQDAKDLPQGFPLSAVFPGKHE
ncbi:HlyD family efflux transporter periplasmic adaptor subunit [Dyella solisilvae]|uniref:HlyD family efflux transporter periplasmic adaptor subunit n=1 Tax=Dyella solisilvae TaxID=1920168 RepID=A0A370KAN0_9GAMM|nr:HlyD family efflux transporter periplasmic adaptor subunit [Dyella solisilvae]RDI99712.1 HlyD family efflux transporter periplasmic adaptor subunit [Dyella solisilvae]